MYQFSGCGLPAPCQWAPEVITISLGTDSTDPSFDYEAWQDWMLKAPSSASQLPLFRRAIRPGADIYGGGYFSAGYIPSTNY
jgi:hypothetical protein